MIHFMDSTLVTWKLSTDNQFLMINNHNEIQTLQVTQNQKGKLFYRNICEGEIE